MLINITGSSRLSLHDVNEACSLIRKATSNEDAQLNFGVVLNEKMEDEVKITVIATGFQRESLPQLTRRQQPEAAEPVRQRHAPPPPVHVPMHEPIHEMPIAAAPEPQYVEPEEAAHGPAAARRATAPAAAADGFERSGCAGLSAPRPAPVPVVTCPPRHSPAE